MKPARDEIRSLLSGGSRRPLGRSGELPALIDANPRLFPILLHFLWDPDPIICMRAADAAEKISRARPDLLRPFKAELLGLLAEAVQPELRYHLAQIVPRLYLTGTERRRAAASLENHLNDRGSIVKTLAMQGLADLARQDSALLPAIHEKLRILSVTGTPAMRARGRKLLLKR